MRSHILSIWVLLLLVMAGQESSALAEITLTGETSEPMHSAFVAGKPVELSFTVTGLSPKDNTLKLHLKIVDELENVIQEKDLPVQADDKGQWTGRVAGPNEKLGFYRVYANLSNGVTIPKRVSRPAGYITYCVAADPSERKMYRAEEMFFGMYGGLGGAGMHAALDPYLGVYWDIGIWNWGWGNIETDFPGQCLQKFKEARDAREKSKADSVGKKPSWARCYVPAMYIIPTKWKVSPIVPGTVGTLAGYTGTLTPEGEKHWAEYCRNAAKAYALENPERTERFYQITWEPVSPWGFRGTDEDLIRIYQIAYPAIHEADPKAVVTGPTASNIDRDSGLTRRLFQKGLGKYLDGFCIHPYTLMPPEYNRFRENILTIKEIIRQYVGRDLPMIATELGFQTGEQKENELLQARGLVRSNLILLGEGFRLSISFYYHDYLCEAGYGFFYNLNPQVNYGTDKIAPKPIVPAFAAMSRLVEGHKSAGVIDWLGQSALGYAYERGDQVILAMWDFGDSPRTVKIPVGAATVTVYDWMGNAKTVTTENGTLTVELKQEPIYVAGVSAKLWSSRAVKPLKLDQSRITAYPGSDVVIRGSLTAVADLPLQGRLMLSHDAKLKLDVASEKDISLESAPFEYRFRLPVDIASGTYPMSLNLSQNGAVVAAAGCTVKVESPVMIKDIMPFASHNGKLGVQTTLIEMQGCGSKGTLQIQVNGVPEAAKTLDYQLSPGETKLLRVVYDKLAVSPIQTCSASLVLRAANGYTVTKSNDVNFFAVKKPSALPNIDGDLAEWTSVAPVTLQGTKYVVRSPEFHSGDDDLRAAFRFAYDEQFLYVAVEATDDVYRQDATGYSTWQGDCVQLAIDLDPGKEEIHTGNELADKGSRHRHTEIDLALTKSGAEAYRTASYDGEKFPVSAIAPKDLKLAVKRDGNRMVYEAAIPWRTLGGEKKPESGMIGFALSVNDRDTAEQIDPSALGVFPLKDPRKFGLLLLGD